MQIQVVKNKSRPSDHLLLFIKWTHAYVTEGVQNKYRKCILSPFLVHAIHNLHCVQLEKIIKILHRRQNYCDIAKYSIYRQALFVSHFE